MAQAIKDPSAYSQSLSRIEQLAKALPRAGIALADLAYALQSMWESKYLYPYYNLMSDRLKESEELLSFSFRTGSLLAFSDGFHTAGAGPFGSFRRTFLMSELSDQAWTEFHGKRKLLISEPPASVLSFAVPIEMDMIHAAAKLKEQDEIVAQSAGAFTVNGLTWSNSELMSVLDVSPWIKGASWIATFAAAWYAQKFTTQEARLAAQAVHERMIDADVVNAVQGVDQANTSATRAKAITRLVKAALTRIAYRDLELVAIERQHPALKSGDTHFREELGKALQDEHYSLNPMLARDFARKRLMLLIDGLSENDTIPFDELIANVGSWDPRLLPVGVALVNELRSSSIDKISVKQLNRLLAAQEHTDLTELASELKAGQLLGTSDAFLLQVQAYLRVSPWQSDQRYSSILGSLIHRYCVFADAASSGIEGASL